jgi:hypothetical protein
MLRCALIHFPVLNDIHETHAMRLCDGNDGGFLRKKKARNGSRAYGHIFLGGLCRPGYNFDFTSTWVKDSMISPTWMLSNFSILRPHS